MISVKLLLKPLCIFCFILSFPFAEARVVLPINQDWYFIKGEIPSGQVPPLKDPAWEKINLPHTWNAEDVLDDTPCYYRGEAWYGRRLEWRPELREQRRYLRFEGANQEAEVFINGQRAGIHKGGYTAFQFDITPYLKAGGKNILLVRVSNARDGSVPPLGGDLCHFGGIYRDVYLVDVDPLHFDMDHYAGPGIQIRTPGLKEGHPAVQITSRIRNTTNSERTVVVQHGLLDPWGKEIARCREEIFLPAGVLTVHTARLEGLPEISLWSPDKPALYKIVSRLENRESSLLDEAGNHFGFRWLSVDPDEGLYLNGEPLFIRGIGMHQDFYKKGYAVGNDILVHDIRLAKAMGANLVRAHYPQDPAVYDACDRMGMMNWARLPILDKISFSEAFKENTRTMLKELVYQNYNRPSIIIWAAMCEVLGDMDWYWPKPQDPQKVQEHLEKTARFTRELETFVRELDSTRLTAVSFHTDPTPEWYRESGLTDIQMINGWNIYQGWYHRDLSRVGEALDTFRAYNPGKAFVIAEYGAGSDPRIHTDDPTIFDFSIEYQNRFHEIYLEVAEEKPWLAGMVIWTLFDFQVEGRRDAVPHINSKGVLTAGRQKKDAYYLYQAAWSDRPVLHICSRDWKRRFYNTSGEVAGESIKVYSNLEKAGLFLNGQFMEGKVFTDHRAVWTLELPPGKNTIEVRSQEPPYLSDEFTLETVMLPAPAAWDFNRGPLCINLGQSRTFFHDPQRDEDWLPGDFFGGSGMKIKKGKYHRSWPDMKAWDGIREGIDHDIYGTRLDPVYQTFLTGPVDMEISLEPGEYQLDLLFSEPFEKEAGRRIFDIRVNGEILESALDPAGDYGLYQSFSKAFMLKTEEALIHISLEPHTGEPVICGLKLMRME